MPVAVVTIQKAKRRGTNTAPEDIAANFLSYRAHDRRCDVTAVQRLRDRSRAPHRATVPPHFLDMVLKTTVCFFTEKEEGN